MDAVTYVVLLLKPKGLFLLLLPPTHGKVITQLEVSLDDEATTP
jgi:hypothetical protein